MESAICIEDGKTSFEDCPLFTSSFGWMMILSPFFPQEVR